MRDFGGNGHSGVLLYDPSNGQSYTLLSNGSATFQSVGNLFTPAFDILRTGDFNADGKADQSGSALPRSRSVVNP